ncbi:MAG: dihydropteroate synthase [Patescibacteria group bacterium]
MGILNVTPDSFSDGGKFVDPDAALKHALQMIKEGADIIDIGGESSGPSSKDVALEEELRRVIPVILSLRGKQSNLGRDIIISVDTWKAEVARQAVMAGASMINDVTALRGDPGMAKVVAQTGIPIVLMYSKDPTARTTRTQKRYKNVVKTIMDFLQRRVDFSLAAGIKPSQIILDPGMGAFVSSIPKYSYEILERLNEFKKLGFPILIGASRKSFLPGTIDERLAPTLKAHRLAIQNGATIIRVHDVQEHQSLKK